MNSDRQSLIQNRVDNSNNNLVITIDNDIEELKNIIELLKKTQEINIKLSATLKAFGIVLVIYGVVKISEYMCSLLTDDDNVKHMNNRLNRLQTHSYNENPGFFPPFRNTTSPNSTYMCGDIASLSNVCDSQALKQTAAYDCFDKAHFLCNQGRSLNEYNDYQSPYANSTCGELFPLKNLCDYFAPLAQIFNGREQAKQFFACLFSADLRCGDYLAFQYQRSPSFGSLLAGSIALLSAFICFQKFPLTIRTLRSEAQERALALARKHGLGVSDTQSLSETIDVFKEKLYGLKLQKAQPRSMPDPNRFFTPPTNRRVTHQSAHPGLNRLSSSR